MARQEKVTCTTKPAWTCVFLLYTKLDEALMMLMIRSVCTWTRVKIIAISSTMQNRNFSLACSPMSFSKPTMICRLFASSLQERDEKAWQMQWADRDECEWHHISRKKNAYVFSSTGWLNQSVLTHDYVILWKKYKFYLVDGALYLVFMQRPEENKILSLLKKNDAE